MFCRIGSILILCHIHATYMDEFDSYPKKIFANLFKNTAKMDGINVQYTKAKLDNMVDSYVRNLDLNNMIHVSSNTSKPREERIGGLERMPFIHLELGQGDNYAFGELMNIDSFIGYSYQRKKLEMQEKERPDIFLRLGNSEHLWLGLPLKLGEATRFPLNKKLDETTRLPLNKNIDTIKPTVKKELKSKIFIAKYLHEFHGGEFNGWYHVEKACRDAGWEMFNDGGFRALVTIRNRPLSNILPEHMHNLSVVNLAGEILAKSWRDFLQGRLASNETRLIGMDKKIDDEVNKWKWQYYWIGDGYGRTCQDWTSSLTKDVANVLAFNYLGARLKRDVATCSIKFNVLCYSVCDEHDSMI